MTISELWLRVLEKAFEQHHPDPVKVAGDAITQYKILFPIQPRSTGPSAETVAEALRLCHGSKSKAARQLGISRWTVTRILQDDGRE